MISRLLYRFVLFMSKVPRCVLVSALVLLVLLPFGSIIGAKIYQTWDDDPDRGAVAMSNGRFDENYATPEYLDQGWDANDSLWFYNTTQGSALMPYDFLLALEQPERRSENAPANVSCDRQGQEGEWFLCDEVMDGYRYLPQKATLFNPDALPVGFVKETYQGKDYVGFTCAACHTGQVNYQGRALRIDGGSSMADMTTFLINLTRAMAQTQRVADKENPRLDRFVDRVLALDNDYDNASEVEADLDKWTQNRSLYNFVNHSTHEGKAIRYGYARLDAFGRIYNRVLQHAINRDQISKVLRTVYVTREGKRQRVLSDAEVDKVLEGVGNPADAVLRDEQFTQIVNNLRSDAPGYPDLSMTDMLRVRDVIFNSPNAPVSYPFLWDIAHSDFVQWNGLAGNGHLGPLGRNVGEVLGVFAIMDWHTDDSLWGDLKKLSLPAILSGQSKKDEVINFQTSADVFNLQRLESHLTSLTSPRWPFCRNQESGEYYLPTGPEDVPVDRRDCNPGDYRIDKAKAERGKVIYAQRCQSCHDVIQPDAWDRLVVSKMTGISHPETTDEAMAENSVLYTGKSGNLRNTYQATDVGNVVVQEDTPVVQVLTAATKGVIGTPDADTWWFVRGYEWVYSLVMSLFDNPMGDSVKAGSYQPDTTANPYNSLLSYRARSLNGIWATAPYLHNGSVPSLYDLLLPQKAVEGECEKTRPSRFTVGSREFDPVKVGLQTEGYDGFEFNTELRGNSNKGHEYGACGMTDAERWALIEYLKSL